MGCRYLAVSFLLVPFAVTTSVFSQEEDSRPRAEPAVKIIEGGKGRKWSPKTLEVQLGDVIEWHVKEGQHGVIFEDRGQARKALEHIGGLPIEYHELYKKPAMGTDPITREGDKTLILRVRVKALPKTVKEIPYWCTNHNLEMQGKLILGKGK